MGMKEECWKQVLLLGVVQWNLILVLVLGLKFLMLEMKEHLWDLLVLQVDAGVLVELGAGCS